MIITGHLLLQGRSLPKGGGLCLALEYQICDVVEKKNFRTHRDRDQESLLVNKNKGKVEKYSMLPRHG
jgi:hypothetical protein